MERYAAVVGRHFPGVGGEFRMLFPAQDGGAEWRAVMFLCCRRRRETARITECNQVGAVSLGPRAGSIETEMQNTRRNLQRREWPGVEFAEDGGPEWMRRQPRRFAVADQNLRAHGSIPLDQAPEKMSPRSD